MRPRGCGAMILGATACCICCRPAQPPRWSALPALRANKHGLLVPGDWKFLGKLAPLETVEHGIGVQAKITFWGHLEIIEGSHKNRVPRRNRPGSLRYQKWILRRLGRNRLGTEARGRDDRK
jgi:hypothetical protein